MKKILGLVVVFSMMVVLIGCGQKKLSPNEMMDAIRNAGGTVEKGSSILASLQGAELAFWMKVEGLEIACMRFDSVDKAKDKAEGYKNGISFGYWAFEYVKDAGVRDLLKKALE
jgi:hypothetical protein